jgi:Zn-finger nucleic acid-binding protein
VISPDRPLLPGPLLCACPACARQWDATDLAAGTPLRCTCGREFRVPAHAVRSPRVLRCGNCGAVLPAEGRQCSYCAAEITLEERGLSGVCPGCSARLLADARFCMECGLAIQPQRLSALRAGAVCPRCRGTLRVRDIARASAIECTSCAGLWVSATQLEQLCARAEREDLAQCALGSDAGARPVQARSEGYIPCLSCGELMLRKNFGGSSGVIVDTCKRHGVWLDHRELERVLVFVRQGGLLRAREREIERLERLNDARGPALPAPGGPSIDLGPLPPDSWSLEHDLWNGLSWIAGKLLRSRHG